MKNIITKSLILLSFITPFILSAAQVSSEQIEQFKNLPSSQQQALASKLGVNSDSASKSSVEGNESESLKLTPVVPRNSDVNAINAGEVSEEDMPSISDKPAIDYFSEELNAFGYDVFANEPLTFSPVSNIAIPENYIVGVGDTISLQIFGKENNDYNLVISREGQVVIPNLGPFKVAGLSFSDMKRFLTAQVKERIIGVDAVISLSQLRSIRVFVLGDAYKPGPYTLNSLSSITHALFAAGGVSNIGSLRNIQVKRAGKLIQQFDLYDLLIHGDSSKDLLLQSGDVVFIAPKGKTVSIAGEVRRPAIYELTNQAGVNTNINSAIQMAGGVLPSGYQESVKVERFENSLRSILNVNIANTKDKKQLINDGDVITVLKKSDMYSQYVSLSGNVTHEGKYQWQKGIQVSDVIKNINSGLLETADLSYAIVIREIDITRNIEIQQFSLAKALGNHSSVDNLYLKPRDQIIIFDKNIAREELLEPVLEQVTNQRTLYQPVQEVEIGGKVRFPGKYPLAVNAKLSDLITAAGGITDAAYLPRVDVTRNNVVLNEAHSENLQLSLAKVLDGDENNNIELQSRDRVYIHQIPQWQENQFVELRGEFVFPGQYTIERGESLANVIERAGGFTEFAHIQGSIFTRENLRELEKENLEKLTYNLRLELASKSLTEGNSSPFSNTLPYTEAQQLLNDLTKLEPIGRLVINMNKVLDDIDYDINLEGGDILSVPAFKNSVNVVGQVQVTSSHVYQNKLDANDYIQRSGGLKKRADEERIYILAADGTIDMLDDGGWFSGGSAQIKPGDTLVVPLDTEYTNKLTLWSIASKILYESAVTLAALNGL